MAGQKKQIKTILNKIIKTARMTDKEKYGNLPDLVYPIIKKTLGKEEAEVLQRDEWNLLLETVIGLSGGIANKHITNEQYVELSNQGTRIHQPRNWVDLYDALILMYFFHLRPEDMPRVKSEWIYQKTDGSYYLYLEEVKGNRLYRHESTSFREGSDAALERIKKRKPKGFLIFTDSYLTGRDVGDYADCQVLESLNVLLQHAIEVSDIKTRRKLTMMNIRHTAFYLLIKEYPDDFKTVEDLTVLGDVGFSSEKQLRETYVNKVHAESKVKRVKKLGKPTQFEMIKRVGR